MLRDKIKKTLKSKKSKSKENKLENITEFLKARREY